MEKYLIILNGKVIKTYMKKSYALAKFSILEKTINKSKSILELWKNGHILKSTYNPY